MQVCRRTADRRENANRQGIINMKNRERTWDLDSRVLLIGTIYGLTLVLAIAMVGGLL